MAENQTQAIQAMYDHVVTKASLDPEFRAALLADPRAAVEKTFNIALPAAFKLNVVESPANTVAVVLPHVPTVAADGELSDTDLEAVAGGTAKTGFGELTVDDFLKGATKGPISMPSLPGQHASIIGIIGAPITGPFC